MSNGRISKVDAFAVNPDDIIIAVMGPTGAGKSNLIERFDPHSRVNISKQQLHSATSQVNAYRLKDHPNYGNRVVLVDTPGFDDTHLTDMAILKLIGDWLDKTYRSSGQKTMLAGIVYLHRITDNRMTGTASRNLTMFGQLCGRDAAEKVILVTTMWDRMTGKSDVTGSRVQQLKTKYWKDLLDLGSRMEPFDNSSRSAGLILARVVEREQNRQLLHLQEELVHLGKPIKETDAGVTLYSTLQRLLKEQRETLDALMREEATQADPELLKTLADQRKQIEKQLQQSLKDLEELKVGFFAKLFSFLRFKKAVSRALTLGD